MIGTAGTIANGPESRPRERDSRVAGFRAVQTTCEAVTRLLQESYRPDLIEPLLSLQFEVYHAEDFKNHMTAGVSLFLYRIHPNSTQRSPMGKPLNGVRRLPQLPLDLHFFLTAWAPRASLQHAIIGWAMRTLEDRPLLPGALLNGVSPGVFDEDETVEITLGQITNEELMRIWDDLSVEYQLSVPYIARVLRIDSLVEQPVDGAVEQRQMVYGVLKD